MRNSITVQASPEAVFAVLDDAEAYARWVVGARRIRAVDRRWPRVGSRFHHAVGGPGAEIKDSSKVLKREPPRLMELEVRFRPGGVARVKLRLKRLRHDRTRIVMKERITSGPLRWLPRTVLAPAIGLRNAWSLRRLRRIVEERSGVRPVSH
jgi:uncharacterized protein YndB with AHSA1/START domain